MPLKPIEFDELDEFDKRKVYIRFFVEELTLCLLYPFAYSMSHTSYDNFKFRKDWQRKSVDELVASDLKGMMTKYRMKEIKELDKNFK